MIRIRFSIRLILFAVFLIASGVAVCSWIVYDGSKAQLEKSLKNELLAVVNTLAPTLDGDIHERIRLGNDGNLVDEAAFETLRQQLLVAKNLNGFDDAHGSPIYTMRTTPDFRTGNELEFVVMTGELFVGNRIEAEEHHFDVLDGRSTCRGVYMDSEGIWISAGAPIRDGEGEVVGILQADRPVNFFYMEARRLALQIALSAIFGVSVAALLSVLMARSLMKPIEALVRATKRLGSGDYGYRVTLNRNDEFGDLMTYFNRMAGEIETSQDALMERQRKLEEAYDDTLEGWICALDLRDNETEGHTLRITEMTVQLAQAMGFEGEELVHVRRGALLHDIGKIGVSDTILHKPGPLTDDEWVEMRKHTDYGQRFLSSIHFLQPAVDIPHCHHEKWDGSGYPRGLKGEEIPLAARLFAAVDVWDALRSDRPYKKAWPEEKAIQLLKDSAGSHFDPAVINAFMKRFLPSQA